MPRLRVKVEDQWYDVDVGPWEGDRVRVLVDEEPVIVRLEDLLQAKDAATTTEADISRMRRTNQATMPFARPFPAWSSPSTWESATGFRRAGESAYSRP